MSALQKNLHMGWSRPRADLEYRLLYSATFPVFLMVAAGGRLRTACQPAATRDRGPGLSLLADAHSRASATLPYAFMG